MSSSTKKWWGVGQRYPLVRRTPGFCESGAAGVNCCCLHPPRLLSCCNLSMWFLCFSCNALLLKSIVASCSALHCTQFAGLKSEPNLSPHWKKRLMSITNENAPMTLGWCFSCWKHDLTLFAWIVMSCSGNEMCRFQMWVRKLVMTVLKVWSSSVPCLVEGMRLMGMASLVGSLVTLKMSWSFFSSLTRLCWKC